MSGAPLSQSISPSEVRTIGILGAGRVGTAIARQALRVGYDVRIAASGPASEIELLVDIITPGAIASDAVSVAEDSDLVILAIPLGKYRSLPVAALAGKTIVDVMNYWYPVDGHLPEFEDGERTSSEVIQDLLPSSHVVKTLNHIGYHELEEDHRPAGSPDRSALVVASDHPEAAALVASFIERIGYDAIEVDSLRAGQFLQPASTIFGGRFDRAGIETELEHAGVMRSRVAI